MLAISYCYYYCCCLSVLAFFFFFTFNLVWQQPKPIKNRFISYSVAQGDALWFLLNTLSKLQTYRWIHVSYMYVHVQVYKQWNLSVEGNTCGKEKDKANITKLKYACRCMHASICVCECAVNSTKTTKLRRLTFNQPF